MSSIVNATNVEQSVAKRARLEATPEERVIGLVSSTLPGTAPFSSLACILPLSFPPLNKDIYTFRQIRAEIVLDLLKKEFGEAYCEKCLKNQIRYSPLPVGLTVSNYMRLRAVTKELADEIHVNERYLLDLLFYDHDKNELEGRIHCIKLRLNGDVRTIRQVGMKMAVQVHNPIKELDLTNPADRARARDLA